MAGLNCAYSSYTASIRRAASTERAATRARSWRRTCTSSDWAEPVAADTTKQPLVVPAAQPPAGGPLSAPPSLPPQSLPSPQPPSWSFTLRRHWPSWERITFSSAMTVDSTSGRWFSSRNTWPISWYSSTGLGTVMLSPLLLRATMPLPQHWLTSYTMRITRWPGLRSV